MTRLAILVLALCHAMLDVGPLAAQTQLLGTVGLGRPGRGVEARARALGGAGVALHGGNFSAVNPAAIARINTPGVFLTFGQENRDIEGDFASGDFATADFPLVRIAIPLGRNVVGLSVSSFLDQDWGVQFVDTLSLSSGEASFRETRESDGGVSEFRLELARVFSEKLSLGVAGSLFSGENRQRVEKAFSVESDFSPFESQTSVEYTGFGISLGAELQPFPEMILGAALRWGGPLHVESDSGGAELDTEVPSAADVGASWQLTRDFIFALAAGWENWGTTADDLPQVEAVDSWRFGGGVELRALSNPSTSLFVRLGGSLERLPFELEGDAPWARAASFGLGLNLREGRGRLDATVEIGSRADRDSNGIEESFTRYLFGLAIFTS